VPITTLFFFFLKPSAQFKFTTQNSTRSTLATLATPVTLNNPPLVVKAWTRAAKPGRGRHAWTAAGQPPAISRATCRGWVRPTPNARQVDHVAAMCRTNTKHKWGVIYMTRPCMSVCARATDERYEARECGVEDNVPTSARQHRGRGHPEIHCPHDVLLPRRLRSGRAIGAPQRAHVRALR
jgi:hypothetical protein